MRPTPTAPRRLALALARLGGLSLVVSGLFAVGAARHMAELAHSYGVICGSGAGILAHCPACYASLAAALLAASALLAAGLAARPAPARIVSAD